MAVTTWVFAEEIEGAPSSTSLEILTKAQRPLLVFPGGYYSGSRFFTVFNSGPTLRRL